MRFLLATMVLLLTGCVADAQYPYNTYNNYSCVYPCTYPCTYSCGYPYDGVVVGGVYWNNFYGRDHFGPGHVEGPHESFHGGGGAFHGGGDGGGHR